MDLSTETINEYLNGEAFSLNGSMSNGDDYREKFLKSILDQSKNYPPPNPIVVIKQNGLELPFLTLKSFSLWQGKQKSKKTTVLCMAVAAFLRGPGFIEGETELLGCTDGIALHIDCEQGESYGAATMKRTLKMVGVPQTARYKYSNLREYIPSERKKIIEAGIQCTPDVKLVVIDGIIDLLTDPDKPEEGHLTATDFLRWSSQYNIHIAGVLHQNKADKNARFHVGSFCSQKCEIEIMTEVDKNDRSRSIVSCVNSRGVPFEDFAVRWEKGTPLPKIDQSWGVDGPLSEGGADKTFVRNKQLAEKVFKPPTSLSHAEAISALMKATQKSKSTAKRLLDDLQEWGHVIKGDDGAYRLKTIEGSKVHEGSKRVHEPGS